MRNDNNIDEIYGELQLSDDSKWYAVHTKSRHEKQIARKCKDYNISYYLPLKKSVRHYEHRVITFQKPLFSGYIFCKCDENKKQNLYKTGRICKFLEPTDQTQLVNELQQIYGIIEKDAEILPHNFLQRGKKVKVINGPFADFEGKISHRKGEYKLVLNIELIRQAIAVEIDSKNVVPI
ncbi:MAG: KOW motif-containing protein [Candidatus Cloacimonetes bacterium]|nr:KOW motif-containing protein [Candidatus Cloacimonadota bacterium]